MDSDPLKPVAAALLASVGGEEDGRAGIESWGSCGGGARCGSMGNVRVAAQS